MATPSPNKRDPAYSMLVLALLVLYRKPPALVSFECQLSTSPLQHCYNILISTACHAVFNSEEARKTKLDFFYDEADSAKLKNNDRCMICCATNDMDLACLLESHMENFNQSQSRLCTIL